MTKKAMLFQNNKKPLFERVAVFLYFFVSFMFSQTAQFGFAFDGGFYPRSSRILSIGTFGKSTITFRQCGMQKRQFSRTGRICDVANLWVAGGGRCQIFRKTHVLFSYRFWACRRNDSRAKMMIMRAVALSAVSFATHTFHKRMPLPPLTQKCVMFSAKWYLEYFLISQFANSLIR